MKRQNSLSSILVIDGILVFMSENRLETLSSNNLDLFLAYRQCCSSVSLLLTSVFFQFVSFFRILLRVRRDITEESISYTPRICSILNPK